MMDYYIRGLGPVEYTIGGVRIPKGRYSEKERAKGRRTVVRIKQTQYAMLCASPVFRKLLADAAVQVSVREIRDEQARTEAAAPAYDAEKENLIKQNADLSAELSAVRAAYAEQRTELERASEERADERERAGGRRKRVQAAAPDTPED
jgi:chromosome segregation ATPase